MSTFNYNKRNVLDKTAQNIVQLLYHKNLTLATAESCTGGLLSFTITGVAGSSEVFELGICAYANRIKEKYLGVNADTLNNFGAVSEQCAMEMAHGIRKAANADVGISITGVAGPGGGTPNKPVGTVYLACSYKNITRILHIKINPSASRKTIRLEAARQALILIINTVRGLK